MAFSLFRTKPATINAGDVPDIKDLPFRDKLMAIGGILQDDPDALARIQGLAAARAQQARQQQLDNELTNFMQGQTGLPTLERRQRPAEEAPQPQADPTQTLARRFGGGAAELPQLPKVNASIPDYAVSAAPRRAGPPTLREALPLLMRRRAAGMDIKPDIEMLDKAGPDIVFAPNDEAVDKRAPGVAGRRFPKTEYQNGFRVAPNDPNAPKFLPKIADGAKPVYDEDGKVIGQRLLDGTLQNLEATTAATERGKAGFDIVQIPDPEHPGSMLSVTRAEAARMVGGGQPNALPRVGGGTVNVPGPATRPTYRTQSPGEKVADEERAKVRVEIEAMTPKARSTLTALDRKTDFVLKTLDKALGQVEGGLGGSAGVNSLTSAIPETASHDLKTTLDSIGGTLGFSELQDMRENSKTGGAVGSLSGRELELLSSLMGSLDQGQSPAQLKANIVRARDALKTVRDQRREAFDRQYGGGQGGGSTITPEQARAELARRRAAKAGQ